MLLHRDCCEWKMFLGSDSWPMWKCSWSISANISHQGSTCCFNDVKEFGNSVENCIIVTDITDCFTNACVTLATATLWLIHLSAGRCHEQILLPWQKRQPWSPGEQAASPWARVGARGLIWKLDFQTPNKVQMVFWRVHLWTVGINKTWRNMPD